MKSSNLITICVIIVIISLTAGQLKATTEFNDGQTYDIYYEINDDVRIDYQSPGMETTFNLLDGGSVFWLNAYEDSWIDMTGGLIGSSLTGRGRSQVEVSGGSIGSNLRARDDSRINLTGGTVSGKVYANNNGAVTIGPGVTVEGGDVHGGGSVKVQGGTMTGYLYVWDEGNFELSSGTVEYIDPRDQSNIKVTGGTVEELMWAFGESNIEITGGDVYCVDARDSVQVIFSGGTIGQNGLRGYNETHIDMFGGSTGYITIGDSGTADIFGVSTTSLYCSDEGSVDLYGGLIEEKMVSSLNALITIHGTDFSVDGVAFGYGELESVLRGDWRDETIRHITGTLSNSDLLDCDFQIGFDGSIALVPEPATILLLGLGSLAVLRKRRS